MPREPARPIALSVTDDLRRSRATVALRALLAAPHVVVLLAWTAVAIAVGLVNWVATSAIGRSPAQVHRFLARYVRYATRVVAYVYLLADPFPDFSATRDYPVDASITPRMRQRRLVAAVRPILALPAFVLGSAFHVVMACIALAGWFVALATARMPVGMHELAAYCLRYQTETAGYLLLISERYPTLASPVRAP